MKSIFHLIILLYLIQESESVQNKVIIEDEPDEALPDQYLLQSNQDDISENDYKNILLQE